jgi:hypothetical protein
MMFRPVRRVGRNLSEVYPRERMIQKDAERQRKRLMSD